jgi:hypothetical protein
VPPLHLSLQVIPEGFHEEWTTPSLPETAYLPIDQSLLAPLPATTVICLAVGVDGEKAWNMQGQQVIEQLAMLQGLDAVSLQAEFEQQLAAFGATIKLDELISHFKGTIVLAIGQGAPLPSISLILPATPEVDQLLALGLQMGFQKPAPTIGARSTFYVPGAPVGITVGRTALSWMISTDLNAVSNLLDGKAGGWADTPAARLALEHGGLQAEILATNDTANLLRMGIGYLAMAGGFLEGEQLRWAQIGSQALQQLSTMVGPGYLVAGPKGAGWHMEAQGLLTPVSLYSLAIPAAIIGSFAQQRVMMLEDEMLLEDMQMDPIEDAGNPAAIRAILGGELLSAQIVFRGGAFLDENGNSQGEFAFPAELAGQEVNGRSMQILEDSWLGPQPLLIGGWRVKVWLPNAGGVAIADPAARAASGQALREQFFVTYAWPASEQGDSIYAIDQRGVVYRGDYWSVEPAWNELYGGGDWGSDPVWPVVGK